MWKDDNKIILKIMKCCVIFVNESALVLQCKHLTKWDELLKTFEVTCHPLKTKLTSFFMGLQQGRFTK